MSIKVIHTMHTSIYFVILILYFCELWPFGTYNPNIRASPNVYKNKVKGHIPLFMSIGAKGGGGSFTHY